MSNWKRTKETVTILEIHHNHLYRLRDSGELKIGKHWRDVSSRNARRPSYRWHVLNIERYLNSPAEKR
ncbi:MAG: DNA-binding protein [Cyanobacteria bacterium P01_E01_bin.42]